MESLKHASILFELCLFSVHCFAIVFVTVYILYTLFPATFIVSAFARFPLNLILYVAGLYLLESEKLFGVEQ